MSLSLETPIWMGYDLQLGPRRLDLPPQLGPFGTEAEERAALQRAVTILALRCDRLDTYLYHCTLRGRWARFRQWIRSIGAGWSPRP